MQKELFIQLGADDEPTSKSLRDPKTATRLDVISIYKGLDHGLDQLLAKLLGLDVAPSEIAIDLLIIAGSVYAADTGFNRETISEDGWTRQIDLHIPVSDPVVWRKAADHLSKMLRFLTGDYWTFHFRNRPDAYKSFAGTPEGLDLTGFDCVSLFSGGLDSLIGAIDLLCAGKRPLLISHYWDGEASSAQKALREAMQERFGEDAFEVIRAHIGITRTDMPNAGSEKTQRARSFLFYSMAAVAADTLDTTDQVLIPENGLIALNVPMEPLRLGSLSTRTAHPYFISCMSGLVSMVGMSTTFENPYRFKTKGEMVAECADAALLAQTAPLSMSCSSPAKVRWQGAAPQHCGHCVPCLIRRASLSSGLSSKDETQYFQKDLTGKTFDSRSATGKDIRSFLFAAGTIAKNRKKVPHIVRKPGPLPIAEVSDYAAIYERGMAEVMALLKDVQSKHG